MGVASECGEQEVGVASGSGWNLWVWLYSKVEKVFLRKTASLPALQQSLLTLRTLKRL